MSAPRREGGSGGGKIDRIIARLQRRIAEGQFEEQYEAAQETRLVAARYAKQQNWGAAVDILSGVAQTLLRAGQGGSGGDLAVLLVDVYRQAGLRPAEGAAKAKLLTCLRLFEPGEPMRKKFIKEMMECVTSFCFLSVSFFFFNLPFLYWNYVFFLILRYEYKILIG